MSEEMIPIAAQVGDRTYRIKVEPKNEELVLRTLQQINQKLLEFKTNYAGKDMQDYLAMTMLWFATQPVTTPSSEQGEMEQELQLLERLLDAEIKNS
ncbi:MAG TPA: cell division protein ZapA [Chitinophagaceae bacterium]|nr:cell division protein ZapA [Chitinophagaceae bacterium]